MYILGISAFYHDSAAALIKNGKVILAAQEERFTRVKNDSSFPTQAIKFILEDEGLKLKDIDHIIFYDKPWLKFERIVDNILSYSPLTMMQFKSAMKSWLGEKLNFRKLIKKNFTKIDPSFVGDCLFSEHHFSHAASSFYTSPFEDACVVSIDGVGEWATLSIYDFDKDGFKALKEMNFPNSIGILYSAFTFFCGFKINSGEYKLMGLAPYGIEPEKYVSKIKDHLVKINNDGSIQLNLEYFKFQYGSETINQKKWEDLFQLKVRSEENSLIQEYCDFALAAQLVTEEIVLNVIAHASELSNSKNLCLSGGVALNCVANSKIKQENKFEKIWIHPAPGDAGGAVGAALGFYFNERKYSPNLDFTPYLGPQYSDLEIERSLKSFKLSFSKVEKKQKVLMTSKLLANSKIIGWFQGRMEWGPRALGHRSILATPLDSKMQKEVNLKIKFRENFRPFAPICQEERAKDFFEESFYNPYMQYVHKVKGFEKYSGEPQSNIVERLNLNKSPLPAITHMDGTARLQTLNRAMNPELYDVLDHFAQQTDYPILINTSFNVRGEPIVCSPEDSIECFLETNMDCLVIGNFLVMKEDNLNISNNFNRRDFKLD